MDMREKFLEGFEDELVKQGIAPILAPLAGLAARALPFIARMATGGKALAGRAGAAIASSPVTRSAGQWLGKHPRTSKALSFTGSTLATGVAGEVGMMPFQRRKQVVQVEPEAMQENMLLRQYRVGQ